MALQITHFLLSSHLFQCLWKMVRMLPDIINDLNLDRVLYDIHQFLRKFPSNCWKERSNDLPLRTIKTIMHTLAKLKKSKVSVTTLYMYEFLFDISKLESHRPFWKEEEFYKMDFKAAVHDVIYNRKIQYFLVHITSCTPAEKSIFVLLYNQPALRPINTVYFVLNCLFILVFLSY